MSENKTIPTNADVEEFLNNVEHPTRQADGRVLLGMMQEITGKPPQMWGPTIVGFGKYHYKYESGREGDAMVTGFSPRKARLSLYVMDGFEGYDELLGKLGKYKIGKSCLYINKLADVDLDILRTLIQQSVDHMVATNETDIG